jgi:hypothetical protein
MPLAPFLGRASNRRGIASGLVELNIAASLFDDPPG